MNDKSKYDLTDAATSMVASMLFSTYILGTDVEETLRYKFKAFWGTDKDLQDVVKQKMGLPPIPVFIIPVPVFKENKETLMDILKDTICMDNQAGRTLLRLTNEMGGDVYEKDKRFKELTEVSASKLFELCCGHYAHEIWLELKDRGMEIDAFGLMFMGH